MRILRYGGIGILCIGAFLLAQRVRQTPFSITVVPDEALKPMGFMLTPASPEGVKSGGAVVASGGTDFYGLPVDWEHPSMGAIQWHEPTADYMALVKLILAERSGGVGASQRVDLKQKIEVLFLKVYGFPQSESGTHFYVVDRK